MISYLVDKELENCPVRRVLIGNRGYHSLFTVVWRVCKNVSGLSMYYNFKKSIRVSGQEEARRNKVLEEFRILKSLKDINIVR